MILPVEFIRDHFHLSNNFEDYSQTPKVHIYIDIISYQNNKKLYVTLFQGKKNKITDDKGFTSLLYLSALIFGRQS